MLGVRGFREYSLLRKVSNVLSIEKKWIVFIGWNKRRGTGVITTAVPLFRFYLNVRMINSLIEKH